MNKGIIYLIQPAELVGTQRYKPGFSNSPTLKRFLGYKNGTRYLRIAEAIEAKKLETKILDEFRKKFKLIAGNEYFEGDEIAMIDMFDQEVRKHRNEYNRNSNDIEKELETLNEINLDLILDDTIKNHHIPKKFENNVNVKPTGWVCNMCPTCNKVFANRANLLYHTENNACKMVNKFNCPYCESSYTTKRSMNRHIKENCKAKQRHDMMGENTARKDKIYIDLLSKLQQDNERLINECAQLKKVFDVLKDKNYQLKQELSSINQVEL